MPGKREAKQKRVDLQWLSGIVTGVAVPLLIALLTFLANLGGQFYQHHIAQPWLQCSQTTEEYHIHTSEVRQGTQILLHPQLIVRYQSYMLLAVYLDGYLENEYVALNTGEGKAVVVDPVGMEELDLYIRAGLLNRIEEAHGKEVRKQIESDLVIYISTIGAVTYVNEGGISSQKFCIIGYENIFLDYSPEDLVVSKRLNEKRLPLSNGRADLRQGGDADQIIIALSDWIDQRFISKTETRLADHLESIKKYKWLVRGIAIVVLFVCFFVLFSKIRQFRNWVNSKWNKLSNGLRSLGWLGRSAIIAAFCIAALLTGAAAKWVAPTEDEQWIYEKMKIADQTPVKDLFEPRQVQEKQELWPSNKTCEQLHLSDKFLETPLTELTLEFYDKEFDRAYPKSGSSESPKGAILPDWIDLENPAYVALKTKNPTSFDDVKNEVEKCKKSSRPASLYQLGRVLSDAVLENPGMEIGALFHIAGDAMAVGEEFLRYKDRHIGEQDNEIAGTEDIVLLGVKLYYALGQQLDAHIASLQKSNRDNSSTWEKFASYLDCVRAAGFRLANCGKLVAGEGNRLYAKLAYYMGNLGQKLLGERKAPAEDPYQRIGKEAKESYEKAEDLLLGEGTYEKEGNMLTNTQNGISTLTDKGF